MGPRRRKCLLCLDSRRFVGLQQIVLHLVFFLSGREGQMFYSLLIPHASIAPSAAAVQLEPRKTLSPGTARAPGAARRAAGRVWKGLASGIFIHRQKN